MVPSRQRVRRFVLVTAATLVVSATLSLAIAWVCAATEARTFRSYDKADETHLAWNMPDNENVLLVTSRWRGFGVRETTGEKRNGELRLIYTASTVYDDAPVKPVASYTRVIHCPMPSTALDAFANSDSVMVYASGWPSVCMCRLEVRSFEHPQSRSGTFTRGRLTITGLDIPILPLWSGLALNTISYAAAAWSLFQLPLTLRGRRRRARNQCPRCGYSLAGLAPASPCPECGRRPPTRPRG